ncbi:MAG: hypothetical protein U1E63_15840 [Burkholderiales bacterium]
MAKADRAKKLADDLTASRDKLKSALVDYTQDRYDDLKKLWLEQDKLAFELTENIKCPVCCWECLLECRLCPELVAIRDLEDRLKGRGPLPTQVYSLYDLQFWHQRNVTQLQAQLDRVTAVMAAWEKPSDTLGEVLDKNAKLIEDTQKILNTDSAKAVFDIFMTLLPRHLAIRPRDVATAIDEKFIMVCKCDDRTPNNCCGPEVGILSLRERLVGPLPYIVEPAKFPVIVCCLVTKYFNPASELLATAQGDLASVTDEIERTKKAIEDRTNGLEATFTKELDNPIDCRGYTKKEPTPTPTPTPTQDGGYASPTPTDTAR